MGITSVQAAVAAPSNTAQHEPAHAKVKQVPPPSVGKADIAKAIRQLEQDRTAVDDAKSSQDKTVSRERLERNIAKVADDASGGLSHKELKGMSGQELADSQEPQLDRARKEAERAREAILGTDGQPADDLDFDTYAAAAREAISLVDDAMQHAREWRRAHPGAEVPSSLQYSIDSAKAAVKSIPKIDSLIGTEDGSPQYMFVTWPSWAL